MKERIVTAIEILGLLIACVGVAMVNIPLALIVAGTLIVVGCEVRS